VFSLMPLYFSRGCSECYEHLRRRGAPLMSYARKVAGGVALPFCRRLFFGQAALLLPRDIATL